MAKLTIETRKKETQETKVFSAKCSLEHVERFDLIHEAMNSATKRSTFETLVDTMLAIVGEAQAGGTTVIKHSNGEETELHFKL